MHVFDQWEMARRYFERGLELLSGGVMPAAPWEKTAKKSIRPKAESEKVTGPIGLQLLSAPGSQQRIFLQHAKAVNSMLAWIALSSIRFDNGKQAAKIASDCLRTLLEWRWEFETEHPGYISSLSGDTRFLQTGVRQNLARASELTRKIIHIAEGIRCNIERAAQYYTDIGLSEELRGFLESEFTPEERALRDLPPLSPATQQLWWSKVVEPHLDGLDAKDAAGDAQGKKARVQRGAEFLNRIAGTPLWKELCDATDGESTTIGVLLNELKKRCRRAMPALAKAAQAHGKK
jgi:hypothetical protein